MNYGQLASILLTGVIAYSLYLMIVKENFEVIKKEKVFLVFSFGFPALLTPFPLFTDSYDESNG